VYNEMKGAYSSPDELGGMQLNRILFGGTAYGCDSGGDPISIPSLTYEQFKATHKKHYHPSNSKIFLDGKIDLDKILPLLDSHLKAFDRGEAVSLAGRSTKKIHPTSTISYEISENEDTKGKARVLYGYVCSDFSDNEAQLTASVLCDILAGSNASPLKKALLDRGLAKDVAMYLVRSRENTLVIELRDVDEERFDEIDSVISEVISSVAQDGIEKSKIISTLNSIEFRLRERDYGTLPTGIVFAMSVYGVWMQGVKPEEALLIDDAIKAIRDKADSDHFEKALLSMTLDNHHRAKLIMLPDKALGERNAADERKRLSDILASMSVDELRKIKEEESALRDWQQAEPSNEALESLPKLSLSDIPEKSTRPSAIISEFSGAESIAITFPSNDAV
jgi:Zn-dependent M16 (insulinase) family peptidase